MPGTGPRHVGISTVFTCSPLNEIPSPQLRPLIHLLDQGVDVFLAVAEVAALNEVLEFPCPETAGWVGQLEWPQKVAGLLEVGPNSVDFVDQVLHADDAIFTKVLLDDGVVGQRNSLLIAALCSQHLAHIQAAHVISYILP